MHLWHFSAKQFMPLGGLLRPYKVASFFFSRGFIYYLVTKPVFLAVECPCVLLIHVSNATQQTLIRYISHFRYAFSVAPDFLAC